MPWQEEDRRTSARCSRGLVATPLRCVVALCCSRCPSRTTNIAKHLSYASYLLCFFFCKISEQIFCLLLMKIFFQSLLLCFKNYLDILGTSSLIVKCFENIFSLSVAYLFILLTVSFTRQVFFFIILICSKSLIFVL